MSVNYQIHEAHDLQYHVHFALSKNAFIARNEVQFEIFDRDVVLKGSVATYYQKQMAQESLRRIANVGQILNQLTVKPR